MTIWTQTLRGKAFDLIAPKAEMVDFAELAEALSKLNRYAGNSEKPVSVALHTLIAFDAAAPEDRAHVLLHDAHEFVIGDIPTPASQALAEIINLTAGVKAAQAFSYALHSLKYRIDIAMHEAAGLLMPSESQRARIKQADIVALRTERRDFLSKPQRAWAREIEQAQPLAKVYRLRPAPDVADELLAKFKTYLPALRSRAA